MTFGYVKWKKNNVMTVECCSPNSRSGLRRLHALSSGRDIYIPDWNMPFIVVDKVIKGNTQGIEKLEQIQESDIHESEVQNNNSKGKKPLVQEAKKEKRPIVGPATLETTKKEFCH